MNDGRVEYTFLWFIENYDCCWHRNGEKLVSPYFNADELERTSWRISLYPRGRIDGERGYISLYLGRRQVDELPAPVSLNFELSILAADGSKLRSEADKYTFINKEGYGWKEFASMDYVRQDNLTVRCRVWQTKGNVQKFTPICARTRIAVENMSFLHVVENFTTLEPNRKYTIELQPHSKQSCVVSSSLSFTNDPRCKGEMTVEIASSDSNHILCKRKISLLDAFGNIIECGQNDNRFEFLRKDIQKLPLSLKRQVVLSRQNGYLPGDKLSLLCECTFAIRQEFENIEVNEPRVSTAAVKQASNPVLGKNNDCTKEMTSAYPSALEDIKALYVNQRLTDVELKTQTNSFPAHKIVLCARSPVFEAMLAHDMEEKKTDCIQVDDLEDDIVQRLLLFLYSDKTEHLQWNAAAQLYYAGDKYQIGKLKEVCSSFLIKNLTATNAGELLVLADTHSDNDLKKSAEDFILKHEKEVFGSKEWEKLIETNPLLVIKTMHLKYKR